MPSTTRRAHGPQWAPIQRRADGTPEVAVDWVATRADLDEVALIDVRQPSEWNDALGHIEGALLVPLAELESEAAHWSRDRPIVVVCRSGGRSAAAARLLIQMGFTAVASMRGGMLSWNAAGRGA